MRIAKTAVNAVTVAGVVNAASAVIVPPRDGNNAPAPLVANAEAQAA